MSKISRHLEVIFCDDIRSEVGNKSSYMGIYTRELTIPSAPLLLAKLCIAVQVVTDIDDPFESIMVQVVKIRGQEETELLTTGQITLPPPSGLSDVDNDSTRLLLGLQFVLSPFQIDEESILRVKATTEREELHGAGLRLRIVPPPASPTIQ